MPLNGQAGDSSRVRDLPNSCSAKSRLALCAFCVTPHTMTAPSSSLQEDNSHRERGSRPVRCPKCRQPNSGGRNTCESCGAHLYVSCRDCGERNPRSRSRCSACGRRLHRPWFQKILTQKLGKSVKVTPLQLIFLVLAVAIGYKVIIFFIESLSQTNPGGESAWVQTVWRA